jgi:D-glycero-alpha-D-manno-heptose-7-phosphate kinase
MIITRAPLRISLGGGGTDLPSYYEPFGGFVISGSINQYVYITLHKTFRNTYAIKYSSLEEVERLEDIKHPIVREAFRLQGVGPSIEMVSMADIPAGTGLGSSSSFSVALLLAIHSMKGERVPTGVLADEACRIEIHELGEPIGRQDQHAAAFGGLICMDFESGGKVAISPLAISTGTLRDLESHLLLFFTGYSRSAGQILSDQKTRSEGNDKAMLSNLHRIKELGLEAKAALEWGDTRAFAHVMHEHWLCKKERSSGISSEQIDRWYNLGLASGALGGKLLGAGGGGFLLFYASDPAPLRAAMARENLPEVRFAFDYEGAKVIFDE